MRRALVALVVCALALPVMAQQQIGEPHPAKDAVVHFLSLTPDQVTQWDVLAATREATVLPLRQKLSDVEGELQTLLGQDNPDPAAVGALVIQGKSLRDQIHAADTTYINGFGGMLDQDQAGRLDGIRRAAQLEPLFPAFRAFGLLGPPAPPPPQS
jgi:Spy/CpxP family protein refolding chaperone